MEQSKSLFAQFYKEREGIETIEREYGFATYRVDENYIQLIDVYIDPSERRKGLAFKLADEVAFIGGANGKDKMITTADLQTNGVSASTMVILQYGFKLDSSDGRLLYFVKEI